MKLQPGYHSQHIAWIEIKVLNSVLPYKNVTYIRKGDRNYLITAEISCFYISLTL